MSKKYGTVKVQFTVIAHSPELIRDLKALHGKDTRTITERRVGETGNTVVGVGTKGAVELKVEWRHTARNAGATRSDAYQVLNRTIGRRTANVIRFDILDAWRELPEPELAEAMRRDIQPAQITQAQWVHLLERVEKLERTAA